MSGMSTVPSLQRVIFLLSVTVGQSFAMALDIEVDRAVEVSVPTWTGMLPA